MIQSIRLDVRGQAAQRVVVRGRDRGAAVSVGGLFPDSKHRGRPDFPSRSLIG